MRLLLLPAVLLLSACGVSRDNARDDAARAFCQCYDKAGQLGAEEGRKYRDFDDCLVSERGEFNRRWPTDRCDGNIDGESLDTCLKAIDITDCSNGLDITNTVLNRCNVDAVCSG